MSATSDRPSNPRMPRPLMTGLSLGLALLLGACGGGGGGSGTPVGLQFGGTVLGVAGALDAPVMLCVDSNHNFRCDTGEPQLQSDAQGQFALTLHGETDVRGLHLLALMPERGSVPAHTLAAPLQEVSTLSPLTTFWSLNQLAAGQDAATATAALRAQGLLDADSAPNDNYLTNGNDRLAALASALGITYAHAAAHRAAVASQQVAQRYLEREGALLATVTSKTLVNELPAGFRAETACVEQTPASLHITTEGGEPIVEKNKYLNARLVLTEAGASAPAFDVTTRIRGRGNSTWQQPKKPYRLKLDSAAPLLGMASERDWNLLAEYLDKTLLRNSAALCLGQRFDTPYALHYRPVELTLNGEYQGFYLLTERVEVDANRVAIPELGPADNNAEAITGGYLLEIDYRLDEENHFISAAYGLPISIKSPDPISPEQHAYISGYFNAMEAALLAPEMRYSDYLDAESLVDYYLINELLRNNDAFRYSTFIHKDRGGKLVFGPLWDYDLAAGNVDTNNNDQPEGWWITTHNPIVARFFDDPTFVRHAQLRWAHLRDHMPALDTYIAALAARYTDSGTQQRNFATWDLLNAITPPSPRALGSYQAEVDFLRDWLRTRTAWMDHALYNNPPITAAVRR